MLMVSLLFSLVMFVSFDSLPASLMASCCWALMSYAMFAGAVI